jgi:hypothetical protein
VAHAVLYLASDRTRYVTGTQMVLDAGGGGARAGSATPTEARFLNTLQEDSLSKVDV